MTDQPVSKALAVPTTPLADILDSYRSDAARGQLEELSFYLAQDQKRLAKAIRTNQLDAVQGIAHRISAIGSKLVDMARVLAAKEA